MKRKNNSERASALQSTLSITLLSVCAILFASRFEAAAPHNQGENGIAGLSQASKRTPNLDADGALRFAKLSASSPQASQPRELSLAERYAFQRSIEEVYWRHRIWPNERPDPKPSLDEVMPPAQIQQKVESYLRDSQALEHWQGPISAAQLQAEMERMARDTRQPGMLHELFAALGNDPFVIAECLARPVLSESLVTSAIRNQGSRDQMPKLTVPSATEYVLPIIGATVNGFSEVVGPAISGTNAPMTPEGCDWTATSLTNAPAGRYHHTTVWTGSEMIIWGGQDAAANLNSGGRYNPATDSWGATSLTNAPTIRIQHTAVWTGSEMIIWGGQRSGPGGDLLNTGGKYNPGTDSWTATSLTNAPDTTFSHTAVWTGSEMIIWGGFTFGDPLNTGGRYNPGTDSWTATSLTNAPPGREGHTAVWTGSEMIIWGGVSAVDYTKTGGKYNPGTDSWTATSLTDAPAGRERYTAVWTGIEMIIWGGWGGNSLHELNSGGRYNPGTDSWTATGSANAPIPREQQTAVWTGSEMIIWGGHFHDGDEANRENSGGRYNPGTDSWTATSLTNSPTARTTHSAVWIGSEMIIWGGNASGAGFSNTGGRLCVQTAPPTPTTLGNISTRLRVETGNNILIGGFIVTGTQPKNVIVRAIGASLGVAGPLADPILELRDSSGALLNSNDNWRDTQEAQIIATTIPPTNDLESAIVATLPANNSAYTAVVRGKDNGTGVGLVEVYDLDRTVDSRLANISTRGLVGTGENVMIGGTIVLGNSSANVVLRGIGPSLADLGIPDALANPTLELRDGSGALVVANDNWQDDSTSAAQLTTLGLAPQNPAESGIFASLPPGFYTIIMAGTNNGTGVGLVEAYHVQ